MINWQYIDNRKLTVSRTYPDGRIESCLIVAQEIQDYIAEGGIINEPVLNPNADILAQIAALEASVTERRLQGALGGNPADIAWMANLESQKSALRAQLVK